MSDIDDGLDPEIVEIAHRVMDLARDGQADELEAWIGRGVPVGLTDAAGNTLVMLAAYHGHAEALRRLVALGGDVDVLNDRGQSPLAGALFKGEDEVVAVLLRAGADPDLGSPSGRATAEMFERTDLLP